MRAVTVKTLWWLTFLSLFRFATQEAYCPGPDEEVLTKCRAVHAWDTSDLFATALGENVSPEGVTSGFEFFDTPLKDLQEDVSLCDVHDIINCAAVSMSHSVNISRPCALVDDFQGSYSSKVPYPSFCKVPSPPEPSGVNQPPQTPGRHYSYEYVKLHATQPPYFTEPYTVPDPDQLYHSRSWLVRMVSISKYRGELHIGQRRMIHELLYLHRAHSPHRGMVEPVFVFNPRNSSAFEEIFAKEPRIFDLIGMEDAAGAITFKGSCFTIHVHVAIHDTYSALR